MLCHTRSMPATLLCAGIVRMQQLGPSFGFRFLLALQPNCEMKNFPQAEQYRSERVDTNCGAIG